MNQFLVGSPVRDLGRLQRRLDELFAQSRFTAAGGNDGSPQRPPADMLEDDQGYLVKVEAPGVAPENVQVRLENGTLTIQGERPREAYGQNVAVHRTERRHGRFERSFVLPDDADPEKVSAQFKTGVLLVSIAKQEKAKPRTIAIKFE